jgi:hypothetical protein
MAKREKTDKITLGSGNLLFKEFEEGSTLAHTDFDDETDLLGYIQGGAELAYSGEWYDAKDDLGRVIKTILTEEEATLKSGIVTWNGKTLAKLCSTARVEDNADKGIRTVKIGGVGNHNGKSYALCFHHIDKVDGDVWVIVRGVNKAGFTLAFAKDKETVIDAEFACLPLDSEGTLIQYVEEIGETAGA